MAEGNSAMRHSMSRFAIFRFQLGQTSSTMVLSRTAPDSSSTRPRRDSFNKSSTSRPMFCTPRRMRLSTAGRRRDPFAFHPPKSGHKRRCAGGERANHAKRSKRRPPIPGWLAASSAVRWATRSSSSAFKARTSPGRRLGGLQSPAQFLLVFAQRLILFANLAQHLVESIGEKAQLIVAMLFGPHRIIAVDGDHPGRVGQFENWPGNAPLQRVGNSQGDAQGADQHQGQYSGIPPEAAIGRDSDPI